MVVWGEEGVEISDIFWELSKMWKEARMTD